jgi:hypothetical protein
MWERLLQAIGITFLLSLVLGSGGYQLFRASQSTNPVPPPIRFSFLDGATSNKMQLHP